MAGCGRCRSLRALAIVDVFLTLWAIMWLLARQRVCWGVGAWHWKRQELQMEAILKVRGLAAWTSPWTLVGYFGQFGEVVSVNIHAIFEREVLVTVATVIFARIESLWAAIGIGKQRIDECWVDVSPELKPFDL